jgi:AraC family transcriptional regulator
MTQSKAMRLTLFSTVNRVTPENDANVSRRDVLTPWQTRCIQAYIAFNLHSTIRVMDLVRVVQFAPNRFDRVFKASFNCTPHQYVMRARIVRAQRLLSTSDDSLSKIAAECGFGNQSHLSNLFRKTIGQTPGKWRRLHATDKHDEERATSGIGVAAAPRPTASLTSARPI